MMQLNRVTPPTTKIISVAFSPQSNYTVLPSRSVKLEANMPHLLKGRYSYL
jgi:hypothetical protein